MIIGSFNKVFNNTQNSYKYYWWLSIIEVCYENQKMEISFNEIVLKIISKLWYPVNYFKLSFGKIDQCSRFVKEIKENYHLDDNIKEKDLYLFLIKHKKSSLLLKITNELTRYVPYRFIRPWYSEETRGLKDGKVNSRILELQNETSPYRIDINFKKIVLNERWSQFIINNYSLIKAYTLFELIKYLEKENPNTANLSKKLEKPKTRSLISQTKYWKKFIQRESNELDVFERNPLIELNEFSIDHFLPWSYFSHDLIWNLHPINKNVNSSKSNFLPKINYFKPFYSLQYNFCKFLIIEELNRPLEDYYNLFNCSNDELNSLSEDQFIVRMENFYMPQYEIAKNMGFEDNWSLI